MNPKNKNKPSLYTLAGAEDDTSYKKKTYVKVDGKYKVVEYCKAFRIWRGILVRGYDPDFKLCRPTYEHCVVDKAWLKFSSFKMWYDKQPFKEGLELDKDILFYGNKTYSAETCCFVPQYINLLLAHTVKGSVMLGVSMRKTAHHCKTPPSNPWRSWVCVEGKNRNLGSFRTEFEAHAAWQLAKADQIESVILKYMLDPNYDQKVANALYQRVEMLREDHINVKETKFL